MPRIWRNSTARSRGFTLVELLVVVAIIALLIAILVPALGMAQERGNLAMCMSNLRQLGMASFMYQSSNAGYFPAGAHNGAMYNDWIFWQTAPPLGNWAAPGRDPNGGALVPYLGGRFNPKPYVCPSDSLKRNTPTCFQYSYTANINVCIATNETSTGIPNKPVAFANIQNPSGKILLVEEDGTSIDDASWAPQNYPLDQSNVLAIRHDKMVENKSLPNTGQGAAVFTDGHSDFVPRADAMTPRFYNPLVP